MSREEINAFIDKNETGCSEGQPHSQKVRRPHFPVNKGHANYESSGVTIGIGIDLGNRQAKEIRQLFDGVLPPEKINLLVQAAKLKGKKAQEWVIKNKDKMILQQEGLKKVFDRQLQNKQKTLNRIFGSDKFRQKYGVNGKELLDKMQPRYKIAMYDLVYFGRNSVKTRQKFVPMLVKIHKKQATNSDRASLDNQIINLYGGHKQRGANMKKILNSRQKTIVQKKESSLSQTNKQFKNMLKQSSDKLINEILRKKPSQKIGGVSFSYDLSSIKINGFGVTDKLMKMHLQQGENPYLRDLIVPLKILYDKNIKYSNISISIDPLDPLNPDGPFYQKIYYPKQMQGTDFAKNMIQADYLMKQLLLGVNEKGQPFTYPQSLKNVGLDLKNQIPYIDTLQERTRQWIVIKKVHFRQNNQNNVQIKQIQIGLQARVQHIGSEGRLADAETELGAHVKRFCELFTKHYDLLAKQYQPFRVIKRLAKASILAKLMRQKGCNINQKLINRLFQLQKTDTSSNILPKLSNSLILSHKQVPLMKYHQKSQVKLTLTGGCDLSYIQETAIIQSTIMTKEEPDGYLPFLFQDYIECEQENCENLCSTGARVLCDNKCEQHTNNICRICWKLLKQGETFLQFADGRHIHNQCLHCQACYGYITTGSYVQFEKLFFHVNCCPQISIGSCFVCKKDINVKSEYFGCSQGLIHKYCAENFECIACKQKESLVNLINLNNNYYHKTCIKCCICRQVIMQENVKTNQNGFLHQKCIPKIVCQLCKSTITGNYKGLGDKKYHESCLVCFKCKLPLKNQIGIDKMNNFYHPECK